MLLAPRWICRRLVVGAASVLGFLLIERTSWLIAAPVHLRAVECSAESAEDHLLEAAVDGVLDPTNGWRLKDGDLEQQFAVFATDHPISAAAMQLEFFFLEPGTPSHFQNFGVSITMDERPSLRGRWIPLLPENISANENQSIKTTGRTVRLESETAGAVVTLRARASFTGVTGFRLRLKPAAKAGDKTKPATIGASPDGHFLLTEFMVEAEPLKSSNIALGRQVYGSGPVPSTLPKKNLTDGLVSTYSRPDSASANTRFSFTVDLGRMLQLDHVVIRGRSDGGEADRLATYRVMILNSTGDNRRKTAWEGIMHKDGSRVPIGGLDVIRPSDGQGTFSGDSVRVWNESKDELQPQISELEVYPALRPVARDWLADGSVIEEKESLRLPAGTKRVAFSITCTDSALAGAVTSYRWRIPGWQDEWQEVAASERALVHPAAPGNFELQIEALHTDGVWDQSGEPIKFSMAFPWWREPSRIAVAAAAGGIVFAAIFWAVMAWRARRRLAMAEVHLELHRERLRIARDMHDEIGARLTYIALLADRTRREAPENGKPAEGALEKLADNARSAVSALDDIVWVVSPQHDTVGSLADYLSDYAPAYLDAAGIQCQLDIRVADPKRPLSLTARQGLVMGIKESLQNVVKHASATTVKLSIVDDRGGVEIVVSDNGRGISGNTATPTQSGIESMKQRMQELGGACEIRPAGGEQAGTTVRFTVPAEHAHLACK